jgi:hypothetical protein
MYPHLWLRSAAALSIIRAPTAALDSFLLAAAGLSSQPILVFAALYPPDWASCVNATFMKL